MLFIEATPCREMIRDAIKTFPDECCGFMYGREDGDDRYVTEINVVENAQKGDKRKRFEISAKDYLAAEHYSIANGFSLLGVYHSHPNHPPIASETDRLAAQPYFSYLIISVVDRKFKEWRSWRLNEKNQFDEEILQQEENLEDLKRNQVWQQ